MSRKNSNRTARVQSNKGRAVKVVKSGNPEYVTAMQGLRRSSATTPVASGKRYVRRTRNGSNFGEDY